MKAATFAAFPPSIRTGPSNQQCDRQFLRCIQIKLQSALFDDISCILNTLQKYVLELAKNLVLATGYFDSPNRFDIPGSDLPKVHRYFTEPFEYGGRDVAVLGGKNSAVETALDLFRMGAKVTLIHRGKKLSEGVKYWILPDIENRTKAGEIRGLFETRIQSVKPLSIIVEGQHNEEIPNDAVFVMIGYQPDTSLLRQLGVQIDGESLAPIHDPSTMETNVQGIYVAGSIAAGKFNNKIFIENGRGHGKRIMDSVLPKIRDRAA